MALLPVIGAAVASAAVVNSIKENKFKHMICKENTAFSEGKCRPCLGGSSTKYQGPTANIKGCRCDTEYGWNSSDNRCVKCPDTNVPEYDGPPGYLSGCGCSETQRYDSKSMECVSCPTGTYGNPIYSNNKTNTDGCFCKNGYYWDSTNNLCTGCILSDGSYGVKDYKSCAVCPSNSNEYSIYGAPTSIIPCKCNNGYYLDKAGDCTECKAGYNSYGNKCCPDGSSPEGPGKKVATGCYCMPYHKYSSTGQNCSFMPTLDNVKPSATTAFNYPSNTKFNEITITTFTTNTDTEPTKTNYYLVNQSYTVPGTTMTNTFTTGYTEVNTIGISTDGYHGIFIKQVKIYYLKTADDTTLSSYVLPNTRDLICDDYPVITQSVDSIDKTWTICAVVIDYITDPYVSNVPRYINIFFLGTYSSGTFSPNKKISIKLSPAGDKKRLTIGI